MLKVKKYLLPAIVILMLLAGIFLFPLFMMKTFLPGSEEWSMLKPLLQKEEAIVDGVREGTMAYTILSREGRTDYGDLFAVFEQEQNREWKRIYENDFKDLKPWKIELADIDGDRKKEILTAVRKTTHFDSEEKNRMFIFNYEDNKLTKKWTGSQIAGTWNDFIVGDLLPMPGSELVFIEQTDNGNEKISVYYWFDFGFMLLAESDGYRDIRDVSIPGENSIQITYEEGQANLTVQDGKVVEAAQNQ